MGLDEVISKPIPQARANAELPRPQGADHTWGPAARRGRVIV